ncbi:MAG: hypothetical protein JKX99_07515 [Robiginitomaculum sp.]|nr:hypothetical protein [Robiginitomaculum sp.]
MRVAILVPVFVFFMILAGLAYVAIYEKPPVPGKLLPKTPQTIKIGVAELTDALTNSPWVSPGLPGKALYKIGFRTCPDCINYELTEFKDLHAANIDTRVMVYARRAKASAAEQAIVADLACTRDWNVYIRWMEDVPDAYAEIYGLPPAANSNQQRAACLEWGRVVRDRVANVMLQNGWPIEVPALFWRADNGDWRVFLGDDKRGKRMIRRELGVPQI